MYAPPSPSPLCQFLTLLSLAPATPPAPIFCLGSGLRSPESRGGRVISTAVPFPPIARHLSEISEPRTRKGPCEVVIWYSSVNESTISRTWEVRVWVA